MVSPVVGPWDRTRVARQLGGLPASFFVGMLVGVTLTSPWGSTLGLLLLALIPGLVALWLRPYYVGWSSAAAYRATLACLTTAEFAGVRFVDAGLSWLQWTGSAIIITHAWHTGAQTRPTEAALCRLCRDP